MTEIKARFVLADIEGTTTSISFVKDVLFPYAKEHTKSFIKASWNEAPTQAIVDELLKLPQYQEFSRIAANESINLKDVSAVNVANFVNYLIDKDLKLSPLKTLQGLVWEKGYTSGSIKAHVYQDVPAALKRWQASGLQIGIYSSGSVKAQKLLFGQTEFGDLLPCISAHFDTAIGHKQEQQSYENIANELGIPAGDVLFLTDIVQEAEAARLAGMQTVILSRPGNASLTDDQKAAFTVVNDFDALEVSATN